MLARDFILKTFQKYEVEYLFGNPGTTELPLVDGLVHYPDLKYILSLHEDVCVGMAAGYAQATGKPGVVNLHAAPGLAHGLGNIYNAYRAGVPLIVTAGQQDTRLAIQEPALWGDMVSMAQNYTKWSWEVKNAQELPIVLHRAFKVAMTEPMGPVFLSLPSDVLWQEIEAETIPLTIVSSNIRGDLEAVQKAASWIRHASNPVFMVGDHLASSQGVNEMVRLAEKIGAPVYVEHQASRLNFPYGHRQYAGRCLPNGPFIKKALSEADVVIFVGVTSQAPLLYFDQPIIQEGTKVIAIDSGEWELGKNMHVDIAIAASPRIAIQEITQLIETQLNDEEKARFDRLKEKTIQKKIHSDAQRLKELEETKGQFPLSPAEVMYELNKALPENVLVVDESVTSGRYTHSYLELNQPGSLIALKGGGLGYGMPASLGAQLGRPDQRVVNIIGDGSSLYYIQSLWNAAKYQLPVVFVIMNNQSYMILKGGILNIKGESAKHNVFPGMDLNEPPVDFVNVAKGFGIDSVRIERSEELQPAFEKAFQEKKPILLDVVIDSTVKVYLQ
ncbi:thiamine pyrophosphate-binding protein [Neobacillus sp. 114]|uniref:thiamine pyrophosphate-binding protein n=1 Tax=Neobacillus sp. 114 TaxID=3048535 RepID=UPI0024C3BA4A|nr:thiamine pyrophosphate-binding protein [Neobacillus sp. 114]